MSLDDSEDGRDVPAGESLDPAAGVHPDLESALIAGLSGSAPPLPDESDPADMPDVPETAAAPEGPDPGIDADFEAMLLDGLAGARRIPRTIPGRQNRRRMSATPFPTNPANPKPGPRSTPVSRPRCWRVSRTARRFPPAIRGRPIRWKAPGLGSPRRKPGPGPPRRKPGPGPPRRSPAAASAQRSMPPPPRRCRKARSPRSPSRAIRRPSTRFGRG